MIQISQFQTFQETITIDTNMATFNEEFTASTNINEFDGSEITGGVLSNKKIVGYGDNILNFDGGNDLITSGFDPTTDLGSSWTMSAWVRPDAQSNFRGIGGGHTGSNNGFTFFQYNGSFGGWGCAFGYGSNFTSPCAIGNLTLDEWVFLSAVYTPTSVKVYKDGVLISTQTFSSVSVVHYSQFWIGRAFNASGRYFDGDIYDVRVYNEALTDAEIEDLYLGNTVDDTNLVGWWLLDEGTGTTATDSSSLANDGTISGASWTTNDSPIYNKRARTTSVEIISNKTLQNLDYTIDGKSGGSNYRALLSSDGSTFENIDGVDISQGSQYFDKTNDYIDCGSDSSLAIAGDLTIITKLKVSTFSGYQEILAHGDLNVAESFDYYMTVNPSGTVTGGYVTTGTYTGRTITTTDAIPLDEWVEVAYVRDLTNTTSYIYVNGVLSASTTTSATPPTISNDLYIGALKNGAGSANPFGGRIGETKIYAEALSESTLYAHHAYSTQPDTTNLRGHWKWNGNQLDETANNNDGTASGSTNSTAWRDIPSYGHSLIETDDTQVAYFNGVNNKITVADDNTLDFGTGDFSISCWIKYAGGTQRLLVSKENSGDGFQMGIYASGRLYGYIRSGASNKPSTDDGVLVSTNQWVHVGISFDRDGTMTRYVNGVPTGTADSITSVSGSISNALDMIIGEYNAGTLQYKGNMANLAIWNDVRTANEMLTEYENGYVDTTNANLVSYWKLAGDYNDSIGSNNGTNSGTTMIKDISRPYPTIPVQETIDISALGKQNLYWRIFGDTRMSRTPSLEQLNVDYLAGGAILFNYGGL